MRSDGTLDAIVRTTPRPAHDAEVTAAIPTRLSVVDIPVLVGTAAPAAQTVLDREDHTEARAA